MKMSLDRKELRQFTNGQLEQFFPDRGYPLSGNDVTAAIKLALERCEYCFSRISVKGYHDVDGALFYHLNSDQYAQYLWFLANSLWTISENKAVCDKLILLNRALNAVWISYKNTLPDIFLLVHPLGTVLGNAKYSDFLVVSQNVTVNTSANLRIGKGCFLAAGAKIIGEEEIGDMVSIGVDACVYKKAVPSSHLVYRDRDGQIRIKHMPTGGAQSYFNVDIMKYV